jgi:competence ComEA-like helix-hairpin-helix protein
LRESLTEEELPPLEEKESESLEAETAAEPLVDQDAAFAWLESLAVKQGANEALILKPEERLETMPEWVKKDVEEAQAEQPLEAEAPEEAAGDLEIAEPTEAELEAATPAGESALFTEEAETSPFVELELLAQEVVFEETPISEAVSLEAVEEPSMVEQPLAVEEEQAEPEGVEEKAPAAEMPELPDWLTESVISPRPDFEWTPPPVPQKRSDLNLASLSELERLPGIGFIAAQQIINYREQHGRFRQVEDLLEIPGISETLFEEIREHIFVEAEVEPAAPAIEPFAFQELGELPVEMAEARQKITTGELRPAMRKYEDMIATSQNLDQIIQDLQEASFRYPNEIEVWQNLGDACLRANRVQEALQAYIKAEQLLK